MSIQKGSMNTPHAGAFIIFEDAQMNDFIGQNFYLNLTIVAPHAKKHQESRM